MKIETALNQVEREENCQILLAVEGGSRASGLTDPDSDYDIRLIYVRPRSSYLRLEGRRDVLTRPIRGGLDLHGWDLDKTLRLLHGSNPTLFEWLASPVVYRDSPLAEELRGLREEYFSPRACLSAYLRTAERDIRRERIKKRFYALKEVLNCRWILDRGTPPPAETELLAEEYLGQKERQEFRIFLRWKQQGGRDSLPLKALDRYLETSLEEIRIRKKELPREKERSWEPLNDLFLKVWEGSV